jgi:hypothetical protein
MGVGLWWELLRYFGYFKQIKGGIFSNKLVVALIT